MLTLDKVLNYSCSYLMATSWTEDHFLWNVSLLSLGLSCYIQSTFTCQGVININEKHSSRMRTDRLPTISRYIPGLMSREMSTNPHVWGWVSTPSSRHTHPLSSPGHTPWIYPPTYPPYWTYHPPRHTHPLDIPIPWTYPPPWKGPGSRDTTPSPKTTRYQRYQPLPVCQNDWQTLVKILSSPNFVVGR